jgi:CHAD domain-containing protein
MFDHSSEFNKDIEDSPGLTPEEHIAEAGRKIFRYQFKHMRFYEQGIRGDPDIESVHKMRVAVRRMRIAYRILRRYISKSTIRPYIKDFRILGDALGAVRDLDVFLLNAEMYKRNLVADSQSAFTFIEQYYHQIRRGHLKELISRLDSDKYKLFCEEIYQLLEKPEALKNESLGMLPTFQTQLISREIIWRRYKKILAFDLRTEGEAIERLHKLRIAVKVLRYSIEFFEEILGSQAKIVIENLIAVQDHLGVLNDGAVASSILSDLSNDKTLFDEHDEKVFAQASAYLKYLDDEVTKGIDKFPLVWEKIHQTVFQSAMDDLLQKKLHMG